MLSEFDVHTGGRLLCAWALAVNSGKSFGWALTRGWALARYFKVTCGYSILASEYKSMATADFRR